MSRVLVTGAFGFVGSALVRKLRDLGVEVVATSSRPGRRASGDAGLTRHTWRCERPGAARALLRIVQAEGVDAVVHLAAMARPAAAEQDPAKAFAVNLGGTANVLEAVRLAAGRVRVTLIASTVRLSDSDPRRWMPYFASKRAAEDLAVSYRRNYRMAVSLARLATVYGPGGERGAGRLIPGVIADLERGQAPRLHEPDSFIDLIYIDDAVDGLLRALKHPTGADFDISTGKLLRAIDLARFIEGLVGDREHPCPQPALALMNLVRPAGWSPAVPLRTGLTRLLDNVRLTADRDGAPAAAALDTHPRTHPPPDSGHDRIASPTLEAPGREFADFYDGLRVLVTGSTGFKGSWLALWLTMLGARVTGFGLAPPKSQPSHFRLINLEDRISQLYGDISNQRTISEVLRECKPDVVFHLAAQPIVHESIRDPVATFRVNTIGTVNLLDSARRTRSVRSIICVTSDKCYQNQEWVWGYRETDPLGGDDPYSASKAAAELAIASFRATVFPESASDHVCIASARAGNVIGGGDWAVGRLVPDVVRWATGNQARMLLRDPAAIRPWQHVLEPLSGYLWLACRELGGNACRCSAWNFGPSEPSMLRVADVATRIAAGIGKPLDAPAVVHGDPGPRETRTLRLDSHKAAEELRWRTTWTVDEAIDAAALWYADYYRGSPGGMASRSEAQVRAYTQAARQRGLHWARTTP